MVAENNICKDDGMSPYDLIINGKKPSPKQIAECQIRLHPHKNPNFYTEEGDGCTSLFPDLRKPKAPSWCR